MNCEGLAEETYGFYVLGSLDGPELAELRTHLERDCALCNLRLKQSRGIWNQVALATPMVEPSRALRRRVIALVSRDSFAIPLPWWQSASALAVVSLAVVSLAVVAGWSVGTRTAQVPPPMVALAPPAVPVVTARPAVTGAAPPREPLAAKVSRTVPSPPPPAAQPPEESARVRQLQTELAAERALFEEANRKYQAAAVPPRPEAPRVSTAPLDAAQLRVRELERDIGEYRSLLLVARRRMASPETARLLADPNLRLVRLTSGSRKGSLQGHVLVAGGSQVVFYGSQFPALPPGRTYQLWLIRRSSPAVVSAGTFQPDAGNNANVAFANPMLSADVTGVAVTEEPAGGSALPTGSKLLFGS